MTIAIYGGSFDPPHMAHVLAVKHVLTLDEVSRVIVVPVFQHALDKSLSPFEIRLAMCRRAFGDDDRVTVSDIERDLPRPSYTLHTVEELRRAYPNTAFRLVVGGDVLGETSRWRRFDELENLAPLLVLGRAGVDEPGAPEAVLPAVSSTEARTWWGNHVPEEARKRRELLIPEAVREVIESEGLYGA